MLLSCQNIAKSFGDNTVLNQVSFQIEAGDKFAIVGNNGAGKSTLLKIIVGELSSDEGCVAKGHDCSLGYLAQYQDTDEEGTIYDIVLSACSDLLSMERRLRILEDEMKHVSESDLEKLLLEYHKLNDDFDRLGGNTFRSEVTGVLKGLGFSEDDFKKQQSMLSGGQKTRVSLAKLLILKPDILLLDEPINHLDLHSIEWLEGFLSNYKGSVVIVAHDRYFLDKIVNHVVDLSNNSCDVYKGNYSSYVMQKEERLKTKLREYEKQQKEIKHQEEVIDKLRQFNREKSIKRAESRVKTLDKMDRLDDPTEDNRTMRLLLEPDMRSGNDVLFVENVSKSFDGKSVISNLSFELHRGERLAIIGDNGTGKTTMLKLIRGILPLDAGTIRLGANVATGYYDQEQQELSDSKTLFEEMQDAYPGLDNTKIRNTLAAFMFTDDDVFKKISMLSGGERGRVALAKLMLSGANLLILDEPTNHLDMESKEVLENALNAYTGTLLFVSHDRYFINQTATRILELKGDHLTEYLGNYDYYMSRKEEILTSSSIKASNDNSTSSESKMDWAMQKKLQAENRKKENERKKIEEEIEALEEEIASIDEQFLDPAISSNSAKLNELSAKQAALKSRLDECYEAWEIAMED